jgi:hypothetical protein
MLIQGRLLANLATYWFVYHVVLWYGLFFFWYQNRRQEILASGEYMQFSDLYGEFVLEHYPLALCAAAVLPIILWDMLKLTHRIAGPLVRFQNVLRQLTRGERVERIKLRRGDLLVELQDAFNEYIESLNEPKGHPESQDARDTQADVLFEDLGAIKQTIGREIPPVSQIGATDEETAAAAPGSAMRQR